MKRLLKSTFASPIALIIMNTSFNLPLVIWLMMGFLEQIPYSLEESAVLDGCSFTGRFFMIVLPINTIFRKTAVFTHVKI